MPPATVTLAVPLLAPKHETEVVELETISNTGGSVIIVSNCIVEEKETVVFIALERQYHTNDEGRTTRIKQQRS